jgi:hypothetical protein
MGSSRARPAVLVSHPHHGDGPAGPLAGRRCDTQTDARRAQLDVIIFIHFTICTGHVKSTRPKDGPTFLGETAHEKRKIVDISFVCATVALAACVDAPSPSVTTEGASVIGVQGV